MSFVFLLRLVLIVALFSIVSASPPRRVSVIKEEGGPDHFPHAIITTPFGLIDIRLRPDAAPKTVENFIKLTDEGFYNDGTWPNNNGNGTTFYRYEEGFVLQGGNMNSASNHTVPLEYKLPNSQWTVGLARDSDPNSGSSEFFINLVDNSAHLCPPSNAYTVFGEVVAGFDAITSMEKLPTIEEQGIHFFKAPMPAILSARILM